MQSAQAQGQFGVERVRADAEAQLAAVNEQLAAVQVAAQRPLAPYPCLHRRKIGMPSKAPTSHMKKPGFHLDAFNQVHALTPAGGFLTTPYDPISFLAYGDPTSC